MRFSVLSALAIAACIMLSCNLPNEGPQTPPEFSITPKSINLPVDGGEFDITVVSTDVNYDITIVNDWIKELSRSGERKTGETIRFQASANDSGQERSGLISVCTKDGSCIPVTVNQAAVKTPVHNNIAFRFTGTWCGWCPYMDEAFHTVAADETARFNYIAFHSGDAMAISDGNKLVNYYNVTGFPTGVLNGWSQIDNYREISYTASCIKEAISQFEKAFPCEVGIGISSSLVVNFLSINATVDAPEGDYLIAAFILESGIVEPQYYTTGSYINDFVHDNVARKTLSDSPYGDAFTSTGEPSAFDWSFIIPSSWNWNKDNLSVAVIVMRAYDSASQKNDNNYPDNYVVNSVIAPVGATKEIEYE